MYIYLSKLDITNKQIAEARDRKIEVVINISIVKCLVRRVSLGKKSSL